MMGLALAVVAAGRGPLVDTQSIALTNSMDEVVEIIDFAVSSAYPRRVADADWDGSPTSSLDALIGLSFPGVAWATCSAANLRVKITSETTAGTVLVRAQSQATAASAQWSAANAPVDATFVAATATFSSAVGVKDIDVTTMVQQVMATASYVPGNRINFRLEAGSTGVECMIAAPGADGPVLTVTK